MIRHGSTGPAGERRHERTGECRPSPVVDPRKDPRPLEGGAECLALGWCYLRRRMAYVKTPEPRSSAAAGRRMAGPPLGARAPPVVPPITVAPPPPPPPIWVAAPVMLVVSCANATGARTNITRRAAVAKNIALFIQSSFFYSVFQTACVFPLHPEEVLTVYRTKT